MARLKYSDTAQGRKQQEEKYHRILDAALEVFADKGFHEAKVTEIARVAGVADGTIYLYFKNKDDLVVSLLEAKVAFINDLMNKSVSDIADGRDRVHHMVRFHVRLAYENPALTRFLTVELRRGSAFVKTHAQKAVRTYLDTWGETIEMGQRQGHFRSDIDAGIVKHLVFGALDYACMAWVMNPDRTVEQLNRVMRETTELVLRGIAVSQQGARWTPTPDFGRVEA